MSVHSDFGQENSKGRSKEKQKYCKKETRNCFLSHSKTRRFDDSVHRFLKIIGAMRQDHPCCMAPLCLYKHFVRFSGDSPKCEKIKKEEFQCQLVCSNCSASSFHWC